MEPPRPKFDYLQPHTTFDLVCPYSQAYQCIKTLLAERVDVDVEENESKFKLRCVFSHQSHVLIFIVRIFTKPDGTHVLEFQRRGGDGFEFLRFLTQFLAQLVNHGVILPRHELPKRHHFPPYEIGPEFFDTVDQMVKLSDSVYYETMHQSAHVLVDYTFFPELLDPTSRDPAYLHTVDQLYRTFRRFAEDGSDLELSTLGLMGICNLRESGLIVSLATDPMITVSEPESTPRRQRWVQKYQSFFEE